MESEEERSIVDSDKRDSIHSDWSDLMPVNEEAEYGKVYNNTERDLMLLVLLLHWLLLLPKPL